jgi:hypothetical protein
MELLTYGFTHLWDYLPMGILTYGITWITYTITYQWEYLEDYLPMGLTKSIEIECDKK